MQGGRDLLHQKACHLLHQGNVHGPLPPDERKKHLLRGRGLVRLAVKARKKLQLLRLDKADVAALKTALDQNALLLPHPIIFQIIKICAERYARRLAEAVKVNVLHRRRVTIEPVVFLFVRRSGQALPTHAVVP